MTKISYAGYRFPPVIIQQAIWLYLRFTLSFRDLEDLLAERGIIVSYETVRRWVNHFGPKIAAGLRKRRPRPHTTWHLDEVYLKIDGRMVYLWRAVDGEGEVLDVLVQTKRNKAAALKLMRKLLKKYGLMPDKIVTDDLRSYGAAARELGISDHHERGRWRNNRAENSLQPTRRRERKMQGFKSVLRIDNRRHRESVVLADAGAADVALLRHEKPSAGFHSRGDGDQRQIALTDNFRIISPKVFQVVTGQPIGIAEMGRQHLAAHADLAKDGETTGG